MEWADLIREAQNGDEAALGSLLANHRAHLRQMANLALPDRMKSRVDASDVVQQTCLSVLRQITEFQGRDPAQFAAWLQQIHERNIQNAVRDQLQTKKRGDGREERLGELDVAAAQQMTPSHHAIRREDVEILSQALERLPDEERNVLRLRYFEGRTLADISDELGITKEAVVWLTQKGMKHLRQVLPSSDDTNGS